MNASGGGWGSSDSCYLYTYVTSDKISSVLLLTELQ